MNAANKTISISLEPLSRVYSATDVDCDKELQTPYTVENYYISGDYNLNQNGFSYRYADEGNEVITVSSNEQIHPIRNGLYRMTIYNVTEGEEGTIGILYIDTRHDDFPIGSCSSTLCTENDIIIKVDVNAEKFYMKKSGNFYNFVQIPNFYTVNHWDLTECTGYSASGFEEKRFNTLNMSFISNNPYLTWSAPTTGTINYYQIQRAMGNANFSNIATTTSTSYRDYDVLANPSGTIENGKPVQYRIKYVTDTIYVDYSNTEIAYKNFIWEKSYAEENGISVNGFELYQNYPNPFNPSTTIMFSLKNEGNVTLKLYDAAGQLVETVFEGIGKEGLNQVNLSLKNYSSGTYYYTLSNGSQSQTQKLMLIK